MSILIMEALNSSSEQTKTPANKETTTEQQKIKDEYDDESFLEPFVRQELIDWARKELTPEVVSAINSLAKRIIAENNLSSDNSFYKAIYTLAKNLQNYPNLQKVLTYVGELSKGNKGQHKVVVELRTKEVINIFINLGYFINFGCIEWGWNLLTKVESEKHWTDVLWSLFNKEQYQDLSIFVINDPNWDSQWGYRLGTGILNSWSINSLLNYSIMNWRFNWEQLRSFDRENLNQATVNHELTHRVLSWYRLFNWHHPINWKDAQEWQIDWLDFRVNNTNQLNEFIAHSIWQATDIYEIMNNIWNAIVNLSQDSYSILKSQQEWNPYALVLAFMLEQLRQIFADKWINNFDTYLVSEWEKVNKSKNDVIAKIEQAKIDGDKEKVNTLTLEWDKGDWAKGFERHYNQLVNRVLSSLTPQDYQRIQKAFLDQSKIFLAKINAIENNS